MLQTPPITDQPTKKKSHQVLRLLSRVLVLTVLAIVLVFSINFRGGAQTASAATTHCASKQSKTDRIVGLALFEISMKTNWCWNNSIVTGSHTTLYWKVAIAGWTPGKPSYAFNCYVAAGSKRNCSGNHEAMVEKYTNTSSGSTVYLYLDNWENYKGQFFTQSSSSSGGSI